MHIVIARWRRQRAIVRPPGIPVHGRQEDVRDVSECGFLFVAPHFKILRDPFKEGCSGIQLRICKICVVVRSIEQYSEHCGERHIVVAAVSEMDEVNLQLKLMFVDRVLRRRVDVELCKLIGARSAEIVEIVRSKVGGRKR